MVVVVAVVRLVAVTLLVAVAVAVGGQGLWWWHPKWRRWFWQVQ
jgi:hypothetical protein